MPAKSKRSVSSTAFLPETHQIDIVIGAKDTGFAVYLNGYRVAGNEPSYGGKILQTWKVPLTEIAAGVGSAMVPYAPKKRAAKKTSKTTPKKTAAKKRAKTR